MSSSTTGLGSFVHNTIEIIQNFKRQTYLSHSFIEEKRKLIRERGSNELSRAEVMKTAHEIALEIVSNGYLEAMNKFDMSRFSTPESREHFTNNIKKQFYIDILFKIKQELLKGVIDCAN
ncbi:MAG: hypothetical protein H6620_09220 [Halobacteriovoraceae bacterium]|nr:hypothetical protein [Halobacteriovoraceae bacterium]